jgi:hypothetical protein
VVESRYEFLVELHQLLQPQGYLEIGVQAGNSLRLARCTSLGIDPSPMVIEPLGHNAYVHVATSDSFFADNGLIERLLPKRVDLVFIDGMHLSEYALRDFIYTERHSHSNTVIVFDDVLPYNGAIADRHQPPGDWTGDVWKLIEMLPQYRNDLRYLLVDTYPTGSLVIFNVDPSNKILEQNYLRIAPVLQMNRETPHWVIDRSTAISRTDALHTLKEWM